MKYVSLLATLLVANICIANIIHVPEDEATVSGALNRAQERDTVIVARGSWEGDLEIRRNIILAGEYLLTGQKSRIMDTRIVGSLDFTENLTNATQIVGLHLTGGNRESGGSVMAYNSYPLFSNCLFTNNSAPRGGVANLSGRRADTTQFVRFEDCTFSENIGSWGGCFGIDDINVTLLRCTFMKNVGNWSGALFVTSTNQYRVNVVDCSFQNHTAGWGNSAMLEEGRNVIRNCIFANETGEAVQLGSRGVHSIENSTFTNISGKAIDFSGHQGGSGYFGNLNVFGNQGQTISLDYCDGVVIENCDINSNTNTNGPIISTNAGLPTIRNCRIYNNTNSRRSGYGGIISLNWHDHGAIIEGCVFYGNNASTGPVIYLDRNGNLTINRSTFGGNTAGKLVYADGGTHSTITNSILSLSDNQNIALLYGWQSPDTLQISYSLADRERIEVGRNGGTARFGEGVFNDDPDFLDAGNQNFHLNENSSCIDRGDPNAAEDPDDTRADLGGFYCSSLSNIEITPNIVAFLNVEAQTSDTQTVTIANYGREPLSVENFQIYGSECFELIPDGGGMELEPMHSEPLQVVFTPDFRGEYRATLTARSSDPLHPRVEIILQGIGLIQPVLAVNPGDTIRLGEIEVDQVDSVEVQISNPGLETTILTDIWIETPRSPFTVTGPNPSQSVYIDTTLSYWVKFAPTVSGTFTGMLGIEYAEPPRIMVEIPITAKARPRIIDAVGKDEQPITFGLEAVYPQPLNGVGEIRYSLPEAGWASLKIYDDHGRLTRTIVEGVETRGYHVAGVDATGLSNGLYFVRLQAGTADRTSKLVILK